MKGLIKSVLINAISFYVASRLVQGFQFTGGLVTLLIAGVAFTLINLLIKPIVSLLLLPFNIITLGLFSWLISVIMLYILTIAVPEIRIVPWNFPGTSYGGFVVPSMQLSWLQTLVVSSFFISIMNALLKWIATDE